MRARAALVATLLVVTPLAWSWPGTAATAVAGSAPAAAAAQPDASARADFDGDGTVDLAVGVPSEGVGGAAGAGAVQVLYGGPGGTASGGDRLLTQANAEAGDRFGAALAAGDFNGDGFGDLAAGAPGEDVGGAADAGAVSVFSGSSGGIGGGSRTLTQANAEAGDRFGAALAASFFNVGVIADLTVGSPGEDAFSPSFPGQPARFLPDTGAVVVFYGSTGGLTGAGQVLLPIGRQRGDALGSALAAVFVNPTTPLTAYLAAGAPGADLAGATDAGKVELFLKRGAGLSSTSNTRAQGDAGVPGSPEPGDRFGAALAAGLVRGLVDSQAVTDLAIGAPGEDVGSVVDAGAVTVLERADPSLEANLFTQGAGLPGTAEAGDRFGAALAVGPLDDGEAQDLAVGAPGEDVGADAGAGAVTVLPGTPSGVTSTGSHLLLQANPEDGDRLGSALCAVDGDGDGIADLAAGAPGENVDRATDAGGVELFSTTGSRLLHQGMLGTLPESGDAFGSALAAG